LVHPASSPPGVHANSGSLIPVSFDVAGMKKMLPARAFRV